MPELSTKSLLLVEPSPSAREIVRSILRGAGIRHIREADDGPNAIEALRRDKPDAIITEWNLPEAGGDGLVRAIRRLPDEQIRRIPILVLSSDSVRRSVLGARDAGAHAFLCKPVSAAVLGRRLRDIVNRPREFIVSDTYVGPDRRFFTAPPTQGAERRTRPAQREPSSG